MKNEERVLKAIANKRRLSILRHLANKHQETVGALAALNKISMASTSRHLSILAGADLVDREQKGLEMYYQLSSRGHRLINKLWTIF
ncbi:MAG: metalloregulator ArsR/SmtB family transcription factor [Patescibacteria group bacterium]